MSTVTFYFNSYDSGGEDWTTTPAQMVDNILTNYAEETTNGIVELLTGNSCPDVEIGEITKVEIRFYGYQSNNEGAKIRLRPVYNGVTDGTQINEVVLGTSSAWSSWFNITSDSPSYWDWSFLDNLDCDVVFIRPGAATTGYCSKVELSVTYNGGTIKFVNNDSTSTVYLTMPSNVLESTVNSVQNIVFNDGSDVQLNRGKMSDNLTLSGNETSSATGRMESLNVMMDDQEIVTVSGLDDSDLNTSYHIVSLDFSQEVGMFDRYSYSISLERIYDKLG